MRIGIIGAGWTGCHLAVELLKRGAHVKIIEAAPRIFAGASGNNQNRLHLGFHYPRSFWTMRDLVTSYQQFIKTYPFAVRAISENVYAIADRGSILDFQTYCSILSTHDLGYSVCDPKAYGLQHCEGAMLCDEMAIDNLAAAAFFEKQLGKHLSVGRPATGTFEDWAKGKVGSESYDYVLDCTYGVENPGPDGRFKYEVCVLFRYETSTFPDRALTIMDGNFCSVYPLPGEANRRYTLSGVEETVLSAHESAADARIALASVKPGDLTSVRKQMERKASHFFPDFEKHFSFVSPMLTLKTKPIHEADARRWHEIRQVDKLVQIYSSKITNIFPVEVEVLASLGFRGILPSAAVPN